MSAPCDRFEREGVALIAAGEEPDEHERGCAACQVARTHYMRLGEALRELPALKAPAGWQERVLAALPEAQPAQDTPAPGKIVWLRWAVGLAAAAAAALLIWQLRRPPVGPLAVRQEVVAAASGRRADSAVVGDTVRVAARGGAGEARELRLYRDGRELVARCPGSESCTLSGDAIELTITLPAPGSYRSLLIVGPHKAPEPSGSLDEDARAATAAGAAVELSRAIDAE